MTTSTSVHQSSARILTADIPLGHRQEYWSGLPCPPPGDLSDPGIEPSSLVSPAFGRWVLLPPGKPLHFQPEEGFDGLSRRH